MSSNQENTSTEGCSHVCRNCENLGVKFRDTLSLSAQYDEASSDIKCRQWLEQCSINSDGESVYNSSETSGTTDSNLSEFTNFEDEENVSENENISYGDKLLSVLGGEAATNLEKAFNKSSSYGDVRMKKCKKVHIGNVTKIYGPVNLTQNLQSIQAQSVTNKIFLEGAAVPVRSGKLSIIDRRSWLAQPPLEDRQYMVAPAKFVVISHTATEDGFTQAENVYLVRLIQTFHIESKRWSDIAYNFLIGSDGNVYEGRGWNIVGAHTLGYNIVGLGISFVGCFMNKLPPEYSLQQAKLLINHGIEIGAIDKDYSLVGHCQCCPTESPGRRLYEEIKTWEHWDDMITRENPPPHR